MNLGSQNKDLDLIIDLFKETFYASYNTRLIGGADEPLYLPARQIPGVRADTGEPSYHRLFFREDYLSSALHEVAHWCIAGSKRLLQEDFGYWYQPDGRSAEQQARFESAEIKPQALEWMFSMASGQRFQMSIDNLAVGQSAPGDGFAQAVRQQATDWCEPGALPARGEQFLRALSKGFGQPDARNPSHYRL